MFYYQAYGLKIQSNIEIPQLIAISADLHFDADVEITIDGCEELAPSLEAVLTEGNFYGKSNGGVWFNNQVGKFTVETIGPKSYIKCTRYKDVSFSLVRSFFLGNCMAFVLTHRKKLVIHGSTLCYKGKSFMICGDSGAGKSTLSMRMIDEGARLLSDDISVIDIENGHILVYPGFPEQKLCKDAVLKKGYRLENLNYADETREKYSLGRMDSFVNEKKEVDAMFIIHSKNIENMDEKLIENGIITREIIGADKVNAITSRFFLRDIYGGFLFLPPEEMCKCIRLAERIRIIDIIRDNGTDTVEILKDLVISNL